MEQGNGLVELLGTLLKISAELSSFVFPTLRYITMLKVLD